MKLKTLISFACVNLVLAGAGPAATVFDIVVDYAQDSTFTDGQVDAFAAAESTWESLILSYSTPTVPEGTQLTITADNPDLGGPGGTLGSAGPDGGSTFGGSYLYATQGTMNFDVADLPSLEASGALTSVILHEMAHVIGFGTLWSSSELGVPGYQELYTDGSGQYTGLKALAAYRQEFVGQASAPFVPVELGGLAGTKDGHWDEVENGSSATGIVRVEDGADSSRMLMTGWLNPDSFISDTTLGSFEDIGYETILNLELAAVPEPGTITLLATAALMLTRLRTRRAPQTNARLQA